MPRQSFELEIQRLEDQILALGSIVETALAESVVALRKRDLAAARRIFDRDYLVNERRFGIEDKALELIARQQPMARDLRLIAAMLEIATELERIGDYAKGISKITLLLGTTPLVKPLVDIPQMCEIGCDMLHRSLEAFVNQNAELARAICLEDDKVDTLYNQVYHDLMDCILAKAETIDQVNYLLWVAHNLERAADRVTNICERVVFTVTGSLIELNNEADPPNKSIPPTPSGATSAANQVRPSGL